MRYLQDKLPILRGRTTNVRLRSLVLSNQAYNIADYSPYGLKNNVITMNGVDYTIPVGNYSDVDLLAEILSIFNAAGPGVYTGAIDPLTLIMSITSTIAYTLEFGPTSPYVEMGFDLGPLAAALTQTGTTQLNLSGPPNLLINIPELQTGSLIYYNLSPFCFCYPLTGQFSSQSQLNWINAGKTECPINIDQIYQLTVELWFTRDGKLWRYVSDPRASYQLMLEMS